MTVIKDDTKQMEGFVTVFLDWKNWYCQNGYTTQNNYTAQGNLSVKLPMAFLTTRTKKIFLICLETYNTSSRQSNLCLMELGVSGFLISDYPIKLQSEKLCGTGTKPEI